jgi:hypothetical protein
MIAELAIICLLVVIYLEAYLLIKFSNKWDAKEKDLLNRIMTRNYETFIQGEVIQQPPRPMTPEEIYEQQLERGIPV